MNTHVKDTRYGRMIPTHAAGHTLSGYNTFCCSTPAVFEAKAKHLSATMMAGAGVIIVDVLRATTTLTAVGAAGVNGIHVAVKSDEGGDAFRPPANNIAPCNIAPWVRGGEHHGKPIAGGCIANSPVEVTGTFRNSWLKFVSTNGARAVVAAEASGADHLYLASLPNIDATVATAIHDGAKRVLFSAGGFYGSGTIEDIVCAGRGVNALVARGFANSRTLDDEALMAQSVAGNFENDEHLVRTLKGQQVGRLLADIGRGTDVEAVVTGAGVDPVIWRRMATTVLRYTRIDGIGVFVPGTFTPEVRS